MTATEILRRLLDERGVEWRKAPHYSGESHDNETIFEGNGIEWYTNDHMNGRLGLRALRYEVTPEQAIEATLGHAYEPPLAAHWDGDTLTLTIPRDPSCIRVQRSAEQPCKVYADDVPDGMLSVQANLTPAQAVEATLGSDLKAENDKLRELVRNVEHYERFGCQGCPHSGSCGAGTLYDEDCAMSREIEREKRELGIEADA